MKLNGSEILMECLLEQGVDTVFGYPGGAVLNIYDALYKYQDKIKHILTSHEQGASHAADGYARASGKVGVCIATSGPGATNLVTGIATAYMDSVPVVAITGNVGQSLLGKDSFQEVDITGITMPITKHNFIVKDITKLADIIRRAFYIAKEGRPGPVLIDIPKDITAAITEYSSKIPEKIPKSNITIKPSRIEKALEVIKDSKKPLIYIGGGVVISNASESLKEFADRIDAPVTTSLMGFGGFDGNSERFTGMIGMHGTKTSNFASRDCDLLIAIGARFSDRVISKVEKFAPNAKVLHIDVDPAEINKNVISYYSVIGDVDEVLKCMNENLDNQHRVEWMEQIYKWKKEFPLSYPDDDILSASYIMQRLYDITKGDAIICTEVGQNQMWAAQYYIYSKARTFITSGGLGTMGYGLGASIGAKTACPDKFVFDIAGDGCFRMNCNELATAVEYNIPIIVIILNNHALGMVRQWQNLFYDKRFSNTTLTNRSTDFVKVAEAFGAVGINLTKKEEVDNVLKRAISVKRPVVINCEIGIDDKVFPMVASGAAIDEFIEEN